MTDAVLQVAPLGFQWATIDPFLFCVHHLDKYPEGNEHLGPKASLAARDLGMDFAGADGWRSETWPNTSTTPCTARILLAAARSAMTDASTGPPDFFDMALMILSFALGIE